MLLPDVLRRTAAVVPDRVATKVIGDGTMTFGEWEAGSNGLARGLVDRGVQRGDRVGLLFASHEAIRFYVAYFAIHKASAVAVPISERSAVAEVVHILDNAGLRVLIVGPAQSDRARAALEEAAVAPLVVTDDPTGTEISWAELPTGDTAQMQMALDEDDLADILYTSGTTGRPKGVAITHTNATIAFDRMPDDIAAAEGSILNSTPLTSSFGISASLHSSARLGFTNILLPKFDPRRFAELIETERPTMLAVVPSMCLLLLKEGALTGRDLTSVRVITVGGGALPPAAIVELSGAFPDAVYMQGYGMTESGSTACMIPPGEALKRPGTSGRPNADTEVKVVDDEGSPLPPGSVGEIMLHGPAVVGGRSYFGDPELTAQTWRDGWLHTGDLGYLDKDGYIYVTDRKKDMIKRGGFNIFSLEVEHSMMEHPAVMEAAVIGVPHDILLEDLLAIVRLRPGTSFDVDEMRTFLGQRLADYKVPRRFEIRTDPMPVAQYGKINKAALRAQYGQQGTNTEPAAS